MDRSVNSLLANPQTFYELRNFRHSALGRGLIEQSPRFYQYLQIPQATYWDGAASATEPSASVVRICADGFYMTEYGFSTGSTQIQAFYQTSYPAAENVNTGCLLVINNISSLAITLGSTIEVNIHTDGTHFRWRKNGGAYSADLVVSTSGVSIDSGNATVYFLANSGFNVGDTWAWTRTDCAYNTANITRQAAPFRYYKGEIYFMSGNGQLMRGARDSSDTIYVISVGYRPVFGWTFDFFYDHLVVGCFSKTQTTYFTFQQSPNNRTIGWSDVTDVDNFIPTDTNEADQYVIPNNNVRDVITSSGQSTNCSWISGVAVIRNIFYVFTTFGVYQTAYYGLPTVFSFENGINLTQPQFSDLNAAAVVKSKNGVYLLTQNDIVEFDGVSYSSIGAPVTKFQFFQDYSLASLNLMMALSSMIYDETRDELSVLDYQNAALLVYQAQYGTWYRRQAYFGTGSGVLGVGRPTAFAIHNSQPFSSATTSLVLGTSNRRVLKEDISWGNQPAYDDAEGTAYGEPFIVFHLVSGSSLSSVKEISGCFIGAYQLTGGGTPSATYYTTDSNVHLCVGYGKFNNGLYPLNPSFTDTSLYWSSTNTDGRISAPRTSFRALGMQLKLKSVNAALPPGPIVVTALELELYELETAKTER